MAAILETKDLSRSFGAVQACRAINLRIEEGEVLGMMGANGAGKTTLLNLITGYLTPTSGRILYLGDDITGLAPRQITRRGIARSFQIPQLFTNLTVFENVLVALAASHDYHGRLWEPLVRPDRVAEAREFMEPFALLDFEHHRVDQLSEGGRKFLDIVLALIQRPRLLLLDEPTSGVSNQDKFRVMDTIMTALRRQRVTALFVEHDMEVIARYAERVCVLSEGGIIASGAPAHVFEDEAVRRIVIGRRPLPSVPVHEGGSGTP